MRFLAGRLASASRLLSCLAATTLALQLAACSSDSPTVLDPALVDSPSEALNFASGPVVAQVRSVPVPTYCIAVRIPTFANGTYTQLQLCKNTLAQQQFRFASTTGEIRVGTSFCLQPSGQGKSGDAVVTWGCNGSAKQKWTLTSTGQIKGINGLCMTFKGHADSNPWVYIANCQSGSTNQKWNEVATSASAPSTASVASVAVSLSATSIALGKTAQATATLKDANGNALSGKTVTWSSSKASVASVTAAGVITALATGTTNIVATSEGKTGYATLTVTTTTSTAGTPSTPPSGPLPVIPGVVGFGTTTPAGRGGTVYRVTNLNDNGTGSLRAALQASGPRVVVFEVSGTIALSSKLTVNNPYLTVAGQTAPAPGILLRNYGISIRTHDVLVQHLRIRVGNLGSAGNNDAWEVLGPGGYNIVGDHLSLSWAQDENASTWYGGVHDVTVTNSIISEALRGPEDGLGMLVGDSTKNYAVINSLMASNQERNPYFKGGTTGISANNVVYNWGGNQAAYTADDYGSGPSQIAVVGNVFIRGPSTAAGRPIQLYSSAKPGSKLYVADNSDGRGAAPPSDAWSLVRNDYGSAGVASSAPVWPSGFTPRANSQVYSYVLANAGAWPASRDAVDTRVVGNVKNGTGSVINSQADVGGWPSLASTTRTLTLPANPNGDDNGNGYTNLEEWLQALARAAEGR